MVRHSQRPSLSVVSYALLGFAKNFNAWSIPCSPTYHPRHCQTRIGWNRNTCQCGAACLIVKCFANAYLCTAVVLVIQSVQCNPMTGLNSFTICQVFTTAIRFICRSSLSFDIAGVAYKIAVRHCMKRLQNLFSIALLVHMRHAAHHICAACFLLYITLVNHNEVLISDYSPC
jgi:hypothetical protein